MQPIDQAKLDKAIESIARLNNTLANAIESQMLFMKVSTVMIIIVTVMSCVLPPLLLWLLWMFGDAIIRSL